MPGKPKKKSKKVASSAKTVSTVDAIIQDGETMLLFLDRVLQWLKAPMTFGRVIDLFSKFDSDKDNLLSRDDFTVAMRMMEVPATRAEIDSLIRIIDPDGRGKVDILQFDQIITDYRHKLEQAASDVDDDLTSTSAKDLIFSPSRVSQKCTNCGIGMGGPPRERHPRYIKLKLVLAPFKDNKAHPGHFEHEVTETTTIHGLKCLVEDHMDDCVSSVALFKHHKCDQESFLDPTWRLSYCGLVGGTKDCPSEAEVYYDYFPLLHGCPIIMDDSHIQDIVT